MPFGNGVKFAEQDVIHFYKPEVDRILSAIAFFKCSAINPQKWLANCWVSDRSTISDFDLEPEDITKMEETLNTSIQHEDYLWQIARRMHKGEA